MEELETRGFPRNRHLFIFLLLFKNIIDRKVSGKAKQITTMGFVYCCMNLLFVYMTNFEYQQQV